MIAVDTDIIIWALRGREDIVTEMERAIYTSSGNLFVTPIQLAEIHTGLRRKEEKKTARFLSMFGMMDQLLKLGLEQDHTSSGTESPMVYLLRMPLSVQQLLNMGTSFGR